MYLIEKHIINFNHPFYKEIDFICFLSKNLYNRANYIIRQKFIETSKLKEQGMIDHAIWLKYQDVRRLLLKDENYMALPRKVSNQILMLLDKNWKSFFKSIRDWKVNPGKYKGMPKLPKYLHKTKGRFGLMYEMGAISAKEIKKCRIKLSGTNISIPFFCDKTDLIGARISIITGGYKIETIYKKQIQPLKEDNNSYVGADPGVNNLLTLTSNRPGVKPVIINGKPVKSINQFYNKKLAQLKSELPKGVYTSKRIKRLVQKRDNKIDDYFNKASNIVLDFLLFSESNTLVIGDTKDWKQNIDIGDENNQKFCYIPFEKLFSKIEYKLKINGINYIPTEESYTSKASFLNLDQIPVYKKNNQEKYKFSGYRPQRSWYKIKGEKTYINADVNGSYNIIRKVVPENKLLAISLNGIEGFAVIPSRMHIRTR